MDPIVTPQVLMEIKDRLLNYFAELWDLMRHKYDILEHVKNDDWALFYYIQQTTFHYYTASQLRNRLSDYPNLSLQRWLRIFSACVSYLGFPSSPIRYIWPEFMATFAKAGAAYKEYTTALDAQSCATTPAAMLEYEKNVKLAQVESIQRIREWGLDYTNRVGKRVDERIEQLTGLARAKQVKEKEQARVALLISAIESAYVKDPESVGPQIPTRMRRSDRNLKKSVLYFY